MGSLQRMGEKWRVTHWKRCQENDLGDRRRIMREPYHKRQRRKRFQKGDFEFDCQSSKEVKETETGVARKRYPW